MLGRNSWRYLFCASWMLTTFPAWGSSNQHTASGLPTNWQPPPANALQLSQQMKLLGNDTTGGDGFGSAVAISGNTALVGATFASSLTGSAYIFVHNGTTWMQQAKLAPPAGSGNLRFGSGAALAGDIAVVGAPLDLSSAGSAYVFVRNGVTWTQQAKLVAPDGASGDQFGLSVAISGTTVLVGAYNNATKGAAYVFVQNGASWSMQSKLTASDGVSTDNFGLRVALDGNTAVVGAFQDDDKGIDSGSAYVFTRNGTQWSQEAKLLANDGAAGDRFGVAVSVSADTALIGAYNDDDKGANSGSAYVFSRNGGVWSPQAKLVASDGMADDWLGYGVAISGNDAIVAAQRSDAKGIDSGAVYTYSRSGTTWTETARVLSSDVAAGDYFGYSVSISGSSAIIGSLNNDEKGSNAGAAYVFGFTASNGDGCLIAGDCASQFCVDGVCCDNSCGNGDMTDCQACSVAAGAAQNGVCSPIAAGSECRASAGACDVAEMCDGSATSCPIDAAAANGTVCPGGLCMTGMCVPQGSSSSSSSSGGSGGSGSSSSSGNGGSGGNASSSSSGNGGSGGSSGNGGNGGFGGNAGSGGSTSNGGAGGNGGNGETGGMSGLGGDIGAGGAGTRPGDGNGCGCKIAPVERVPSSALGVSLVGLALFIRRRRSTR